MESILPSNAHELAQNRLHVSITNTKTRENYLVSEFSSREDLIKVLLASSFVPIYAGLTPVEYKGQTYYNQTWALGRTYCSCVCHDGVRYLWNPYQSRVCHDGVRYLWSPYQSRVCHDRVRYLWNPCRSRVCHDGVRYLWSPYQSRVCHDGVRYLWNPYQSRVCHDGVRYLWNPYQSRVCHDGVRYLWSPYQSRVCHDRVRYLWNPYQSRVFHDQKWVDGGLTNSLPILPIGRTVTISPFSGRLDISPQDKGQLDLYVNIANQDIMLSVANLVRLNHALFPPSKRKMESLYQCGFNDAIKFLLKENWFE
ncbi:Patatin-like phospholipase domain-containing protein 4 [Tupaia chinensis]|uniref:Patatin-like phospholipase domain-containing protein 4 n=1 Tax=Tupaia chinensis TaxID=246437 RepID=L9KUZ9_TUPCH|nr:Patatin-like phospholipase domain-containing protein 4 [Tupaia chinensis]